LRELLLYRPERADPSALELLEHGVVNTRFVSRSLSRAARLVPLLGTLKPSVHVVLGQNDPHQRHELAARRRRLEEALGASCVSVFADAAHWLQYDQPERFNELALQVFARCDEAVRPEWVRSYRSTP
jgi:pimeloyl-ACP methyl ester carboxylesterase